MKACLNIEEFILKGISFKKMSNNIKIQDKYLITENYMLFAGDLREPEEMIKFFKTNKIDFEFVNNYFLSLKFISELQH